MRELAVLLFDVIVGLVLFVGGIAVGGLLGLGSPLWLVPVTLLPMFLWIWWRGGFPRESLPNIIFIIAVFMAYYFVHDLFAAGQPRHHWIDTIFGLAVLLTTDYVIAFFRNLTRRTS